MLLILLFLLHIATAQNNNTDINGYVDDATGDDLDNFTFNLEDILEDSLDADSDLTCLKEQNKNLKGYAAKSMKNCKKGCNNAKNCRYSRFNFKKKKCACKCCVKFAAPVTKAPETEAPTTKAPTTKAPTTKAPETKAPTTKAPETKAPTTKAPETKAPTTKAPTTKAPTTKASTTKAPTSKATTSNAKGVWESWSDWSECSRTCGSGMQRRSRSCEGTGCVGLKREFRSCNTHSCFGPGWKSWTSWTSCDRTCGGGTQTRTRECSSNSGCLGKHSDHRSCGDGSCPVDCAWRNWNSWEPCVSEHCGKRPPTTMRRRTKYLEASMGGKECQGSDMEHKQCPITKCKGGPSHRKDYGDSFEPRRDNWKEDPHSTWRKTEWCKKGSWVDGIKVKMSPPQGKGDDTALNGIKLTCRSKSGKRNNRISSKFGRKGSWTTSEECKGKHFITAVNFRFEGMKNKYSGRNADVDQEDSTGGNGLDFQCSDGNAYTGTSNDGYRGGWSGYQSCTAGSYVCGVQTRLKDYRQNWDNTAINGIRFFCCYDN